MDFLNRKKEFDVVGFGEVMLRLSPLGAQRLSQSELLENCPGGSELNVVSGISLLGLRTGIVTKVPDNTMGQFIKNKIRFYGVSDDYLIYDKSQTGRIGIYYYESGAYPRKPSVTYDRRFSSINSISIDEIDPKIYSSVNVFHTSGISLALGEQVRNTAIEMIKRFKKQGAILSFDVNYRANLWDEETARKTIYDILPLIDILFVSEETSRRMMQRTGTMQEIMKGYCEDFGVKIVASTHRVVKSPKCHSFNSTLYVHEEDKYYTGVPYENIDVIDRIGSGDAYVAGALFGLLKTGNPQAAIDFGNASSAVKNTIPGDMPASDYAEISHMISVHNSGRDSGEMNR
ncbi:sugar kinase [Youxingia wuxianensis]|uniref:Sugar kinase n=1 Tax=Youxingia wuxianensis TaxID=2763678 RepID=A0A926IGV9_9FIRM|nr:sugar kinase [Youxingia wuxianensis]MBC8584083.1 sugar kinase [Youxingia wuxianensis]